jgi:transposase
VDALKKTHFFDFPLDAVSIMWILIGIMAPALLQAENEELKAEVKRLVLRVKALEKELYGSKADRRKEDDPAQQTFAGMDEAAAPKAAPTAAAPRRSERRGAKKGPRPLNPDLPRVEEHVPDPAPGELVCPVTGAPMKPAFSEKVEVLARKPAEYYVRVLVRRVFVSPAGEGVAYSPWPADVMPRSRIDASVVGSVLCARFADHQPYYRQSGQFARHGVDLAPNTVGALVRLAEEKLEAVYRAVVRQTLACGYLMMDPTPVRLRSERKKGSTKEASLWTYRALEGPVFFEFAEGKHGSTPAKTLKDYQGILQTDGANNFGGVPARADITHLNCWAHVRRYFVKAEDAGDPRASEWLDSIDRLFRRERIIRRYRLDAVRTLELRRRYGLPAVDALFAKARAFAQTERMLKTPLPVAVAYLLARTSPLRECFLHAPSRIDNNLAENALRPIKLGAKNWLFIGHENAGPRAAMMFTLAENCRMLGINPEAYFIDVLRRVDDHPARRIDELTPHGWEKSKNT